jgi:hypothetical protein
MSYIGISPSTAAFPFDQFSGNGSTTAFTMSYAPASTTSIVVSISGVVQNPNTYSVSGLTLTFSPAPPTGTNNIGVLYLGIPASTPSGSLGTPTAGVLSNCTVDGTDAVGFRNIPINSQPAAYTAVLSDSGKAISHPSTDALSRTYTIPANSSVAYPLGTVLTFTNMASQVLSIAINTDTMYLAGTGATGTRSLAQYGMASALKLTATTWIISGNGLT